MTHGFVAACRHGVLFTTLVAMGGSQAGAAPAAPAPDAGPTVAIKPLTKYTLPDKTASVMLPDGWHVTQTAVGFIRAEGPKGELGFFGVSVPAHDGTGGGAAPPAPLSQPYSADAGDKLSGSIQWVRAANQQSPVQVTKIYSKEDFDGPPGFGTCTKMTATLGVQRSVLDAEADLCSLPKDKAGNYTNFLKMVAISPALAKTERGTLEAVLASYVVNLKAVEQAAAAQAKQPSGAAAPSKMSSNMGGNMAANTMGGNRGPANTNPFTPQGRQGLQQQIDAEIKAGGFTPQMVAAMRAQANRQAAVNIAPIARQMAATNQAMDYFDRTTLRDQIPVAITNQGTFWLDTD